MHTYIQTDKKLVSSVKDNKDTNLLTLVIACDFVFILAGIESIDVDNDPKGVWNI